jgi:hypothetical protein
MTRDGNVRCDGSDARALLLACTASACFHEAHLRGPSEEIDAAARQAVFADQIHTCYYADILQTGLAYTRKASQFWRRETSHLVAPNFDEWPIS